MSYPVPVTGLVRLVDLSILIVWMSPFVVLWFMVDVFIFRVFFIKETVSKQCRP